MEIPSRDSLGGLVGPGYVGPLWCDGREILRRLFVTVRDRRWQEVTPTQWDAEINELAGCVNFNARHVSADVDFSWTGCLKLRPDLRELRFAFAGKALRDMEICRVGLVLLHPVDSMIQSRLSMVGPQGKQQLTVPRLISPQPIVNGLPQAMAEPFSELEIERGDFGRLQLKFGGDLFELEDQRNWGDASFKSYCTPLRLGFPRLMKAGTTVSQEVEVRFTLLEAHRVQAAPRNDIRRNTVFPTIGCEGDPKSILHHPAGSELGWHHVRFQLGRNEDASPIELALDALRATKVELQIEVEADASFPAEQIEFVSRIHERTSRLIVCGRGSSLPAPRAVERVCQALDAAGARSFPILSGTRGHFVEFNRATLFNAPVAGVSFPLTPTVHADDLSMIAENVATVSDIAETARHLTGADQIVISPLALHYPWAGKPSSVPEAFAIAWAAAAVANAALAGVNSLTLGADLLTALSMERADSKRFVSGLLDCAGQGVARSEVPLPVDVHAITFGSVRPSWRRMLVANLGQQTAHLSLVCAGFRAASLTDALTGAELDPGEGDIEIPKFGTMWIELESMGAARNTSAANSTWQ